MPFSSFSKFSKNIISMQVYKEAIEKRDRPDACVSDCEWIVSKLDSSSTTERTCTEVVQYSYHSQKAPAQNVITYQEDFFKYSICLYRFLFIIHRDINNIFGKIGDFLFSESTELLSRLSTSKIYQ